METINIKIIHPTNNSDIEIGCPENMLMRDVFSQLIEANFLSGGQIYVGVLKPSNINNTSQPLENNKTLRENSVVNNDTIQTIIATQAGGTWNSSKESPTSGIKILGITNIPEVSFEEMLKQEQSIIMALNSYQKLEEENRATVAEFNKLKQQVNDRKSAVIINTVGGIVIAIGAAFLTTAIIPSITTISAGVIITIVGLWLTFKN